MRRWWPGEIPALAQIREEHLVRIHDWGEIDGHLFVEMDLIKGPGLDTLLARHQGLLTPERSATVITHVAAALDGMHRAGMIHRDVRPSKILVAPDGVAHLLPLGMATLGPILNGLGSEPFWQPQWAYWGPETFTGKGDETTRLDTYSLACVLYECLTGSTPYTGSQAEIITGHLTKPVPPPSTSRRAVPVGLDVVIARGLAKNPADRYASAGEFARAVAYLPPPGSDAPAMTWEPRSRCAELNITD